MCLLSALARTLAETRGQIHLGNTLEEHAHDHGERRVKSPVRESVTSLFLTIAGPVLPCFGELAKNDTDDENRITELRLNGHLIRTVYKKTGG